ncbi:transmembrane protease serine 9-like [Cydia pomonella]|uniref:transmembrane protease serine 9-like n=1 Tax=Cydia pomonella TaxID=82600 RepID=UPI002ADD4694|nr:transmembrane protease serine 9-like [Cydia pomonella]
MLLLSIFLLNVLNILYAIDSSKTVDEAVVKRVQITNAPYFAALPGVCDAAIISDSWLVTAAHCIESMVGNLVWVGGDSVKTSKLYTINDVIVHPEYSTVSKLHLPINDIALLHLSRPLPFSDTVQPVTLPEMKYQLNAVHTSVGKGRDQTGKLAQYLMSMNVRTLDMEECLSYVPLLRQMITKPHLEHIKEVTVCAKRTENIPGLCYSDSGSPLVRNQTLVGIASYISDDNCLTAKLGMFANVAAYVEWIYSITGVGKQETTFVIPTTTVRGPKPTSTDRRTKRAVTKLTTTKPTTMKPKTTKPPVKSCQGK